jgi:hypothetical protein
MTGLANPTPLTPEETRLARATIRQSGPVGHPIGSFFEQPLPVLEVEGSILVELFTDGGDAEGLSIVRILERRPPTRACNRWYR